MTCREFHELIAAKVEADQTFDKWTIAERGAGARHLATCPKCLEFGMQLLVEKLREDPAEALNDLAIGARTGRSDRLSGDPEA